MTMYLGVDSGGTGSRFAWMDQDGAIVAAGKGPSIQVARLGLDSSARRLKELLRDAGMVVPHASVVQVVAGLAGAGRPELRQELCRQVESSIPGALRVVPDTVVAAAAGTWQEAGLTLWAGTGSFAILRCPNDQLIRGGGRGPLLSDHGSGYAIGVAAGRALCAELDDVGEPTALTRALSTAFAVAPQGVPAAMQGATAAEIAALCPLICECAAAGDESARNILADAARNLIKLGAAIVRRKNMDLSKTRIAFGGGALAHPLYQRLLREELSAQGWLGVAHPARRPAEAAANLARAIHQNEQPYMDWCDGRTA